MSVSVLGFQPLPGATVALNATATSASIEVRASSQPELQNKWYWIQNFDAANVVFIEVGLTSAVTATLPTPGGTSGSFPVGPGKDAVIDGSNGRFVAAVCGAALTASVYITPGHIGEQ